MRRTGCTSIRVPRTTSSSACASSIRPGYFDSFAGAYKMGRVGGEMARAGSSRQGRRVECHGAARARLLEEALGDLQRGAGAGDRQGVDGHAGPLGIDKGKPFAPDQRQTAILLKGAAMGELMLRNLQVNPRFAEPYWEGTHWYKSFDFQFRRRPIRSSRSMSAAPGSTRPSPRPRGWSTRRRAPVRST